MNARTTHRLDGLESDNLLAFLALLGLLRALEAADSTLHPRAAWGCRHTTVAAEAYSGTSSHTGRGDGSCGQRHRGDFGMP